MGLIRYVLRLRYRVQVIGAEQLRTVTGPTLVIVPATNALGASRRLVGDVRLHAGFSVYAAVQVLLSLVVVALEMAAILGNAVFFVNVLTLIQRGSNFILLQ